MLPVGLLTQEVERCTGIAGVTGATPVQAFIFLKFLFAVAKIASTTSSTTVIKFFTFKNCLFYIYGTSFLVNLYSSNFWVWGHEIFCYVIVWPFKWKSCSTAHTLSNIFRLYSKINLVIKICDNSVLEIWTCPLPSIKLAVLFNSRPEGHSKRIWRIAIN